MCYVLPTKPNFYRAYLFQKLVWAKFADDSFKLFFAPLILIIRYTENAKAGEQYFSASFSGIINRNFFLNYNRLLFLLKICLRAIKYTVFLKPAYLYSTIIYYRKWLIISLFIYIIHILTLSCKTIHFL